MRYLIVWDLDGCLYNYHTLPDYGFYRLCDEANARAAQEVFPDMPYEKALELSAQSFKEYHDCMGAFVNSDYAKDRDPLQVRETLFKRYHAILFDMLVDKHPDFFDHTATTAEAFERMSGGPFSHAILSHSCMQNWGIPILQRIGILHHFEPHLLFGMDDYGFQRKFESAAPMQRVIEASGFTADRIIFAEDSVRNKEPALRICRVHGAHIHFDGPAPQSLPDGVMWVCRTPSELLEMIERDFRAMAKSRALNSKPESGLRLK